MNRRLLALAREAEPDLSFFVLFEDEIDPETIKGVGAAGGPTVNWFTDDHWRFDRFTRHFAPAFDWSVTTDRDSLPRYRQIGYERAILSQWACNRYAYDWTGRELEYDVTFVGRCYGERPATVERLRAEGFDVRCWGFGWPEGRIEHDEMVRVFGASRINLNLSAAYSPPRGIRTRIADLVRRQTQEPRKSQIKGRTFEVPGSGGFLLTDRVPHLEDYPDSRPRDRRLLLNGRSGQPGGLVARPRAGARPSGGSRISPRARRAHLRSSLRGDLRPHRTRRTTFSGRQRRT